MVGMLCALAMASSNAVLEWNKIARDLTKGGDVDSFRAMTLLSVAQWRASTSGVSIDAVSAALLEQLFPAQGDVLRQQHPANDAAAEALVSQVLSSPQGRSATATRPSSDLLAPFAAKWLGWKPINGVSSGATIPLLAPWALKSADQLQPPPCPAPGSEDLKAALKKTWETARDRTRLQLAKANYWQGVDSGLSLPVLWNAIAADLLAKHKAGVAVAARTLALMNAAMWDAGIACYESAYHYGLARPSQLDPSIQVALPLPSSPAYPSPYGCFSAAAWAALTVAYPSERTHLLSGSVDAANSGVWVGADYWFDAVAGLELGQAAAEQVLAHPERLK